jgi:serine/threonine protein kinase/tetratricopeptide (TPR) repeat protein
MPETRISRYRIVRQIGAGGMGEVLLAEDTELERSVAIKVMSAELAKDETQRKRFRSEVRAISGLNHPNICVIHEVGETEDGRPFLAMEYIDGHTLDVVLQQRRLKIREVINIGIQVAEALEAAHARNIVHRDIKPGNIMLDQRGQAKVLDFGLAKRIAGDHLAAMTTAITQPGFLVGTPHYMSPEQVLGRELDARTDIFSLGVILYEMVAGQRPFLGKAVGEVLNHIVNQQPESLGLDHPVFSPRLDQIIFKCLEKEPENRYSSAHALAADLSKLKADAEKASTAAGNTPLATPAPQIPAQNVSGSSQKRSFPTERIVLGALLLAALGMLTWALLRKGGSPRTGESVATKSVASPTAAPAKSVAVLPFDNFSPDKDTDYLSDGLTEEITTALARVPGLRVAARNSAFVFKNQKEDLRKVGNTLGVATVLEGSLRKAGPRIRVTAQLINARDGLLLWAETYDRSVDDILAVQEDIAGKIADKFELKPAATASTSAPHAAAPNQEAYGLYLKGLHAWNKRTKEDLEQAAQQFKQAIDKDPTYAAAYAGLASTYALLPDYASRPQSEYFPLARAAAEKALALDPGSADAYAVLGVCDSYSRNYTKSEEEFRRAIQLNPNHATAHHWYGVLLRGLNRTDEAGVEMRQAEALDPLSPIIKFNLLTWLGYSRQYQPALELCERYLKDFPDFALFHAGRGWLLERLGRYPEAVTELLIARGTVTNTPYFLGMVGYMYARSGNTNNAQKVLTELEAWKNKGYAVRADMAQVHVGLREFDPAMDEFEAAFANGEALTDLLADPTMDELRNNPRFQALLQKLGLRK